MRISTANALPLYRLTHKMRPCAIVSGVSIDQLPPEFAELRLAIVTAIRRAYANNAERHDPLAGDDAVVFGVAIYRHSWHLLETAIDELEHWQSARPSGSLVVTGAGLRIHCYRHGQNADVDLDAFRLDSPEMSETKRLIAQTNTQQLVLFDDTPAPTPDRALSDLVIVHAGNPDDGCCAIWLGAPIATETINTSPWAWIEPLWTGEPVTSSATTGPAEDTRTLRHDELPEPALSLEVIDQPRADEK